MRKDHVVAASIAATVAVMVALLLAPAAGAADLELRFVSGQPQDTKVGDTIRTADLNVAGGDIKIGVFNTTTNTLVTTFSKPIGFVLNPAAGFATGNVLDVTPQLPVNGVATFSEGTLSIDTENEPQFTDYSLVPVTTKGQFVTGPASLGFDVWEDGESCTGGTDTCVATLRGADRDTYTLAAAGTLGASELFDELPGLACPGQAEIFDNRIFSYATTGSAPLAPVKLVNHITKADWRASANNGQAHADWCIGLLTAADWNASGAVPTRIDTDMDGTDDLWVALAPKCPTANPSGSAPCIESQKSDGKGGSITIGWLPGGDPPRRT
jgi:hypothetical protein